METYFVPIAILRPGEMFSSSVSDEHTNEEEHEFESKSCPDTDVEEHLITYLLCPLFLKVTTDEGQYKSTFMQFS